MLSLIAKFNNHPTQIVQQIDLLISIFSDLLVDLIFKWCIPYLIIENTELGFSMSGFLYI